MKLLLDEMHAASAAIALRKSGYDVVAVTEGPLRSLSDHDLLAEAALEGRALVTENIGDFRALAAEWALSARQHAGIVYTHPLRVPRAASSYPGILVRALRPFLKAPPPITRTESWEWWLGT